MRTQRFEFVDYGPDAQTATASREIRRFESRASALAFAGRKARRIKGPVDIALDGPEAWDRRYITTASPSEHHAKGYRFERLD